jgi:hypothetical protein
MNLAPNYIPDTNRFNLSGPPKWWLDKLREFDDSLVVIPSRQEFLYRLAQRRPPDLKTNIINESLASDRDTAMLASYGLIPVTTIVATARWDNPLMWNDLAERAPHRNGGAAAYEARLNDLETQQNIQKAALINDRNTYLSKDAWKMYQIKTGTRIGLAPSTKPNRAKPTFEQAPSFRIK